MEDLSFNLKDFMQTYLSLVFKIGLVLVILSTFFLFSNSTTELYDTPKFLILLTFTGLLLVFLALRFTVNGKVAFFRTPLDIPLLLLLSVGIVSTVLSQSPYVALLGDNLRIHSSLISIITYVLFFFVLVNNLKNIREIKGIVATTTVASQILAVVTLLSYAGVKLLPAPWIQAANFTTTGSSFSTTAILALLLPFILMQLLSASKPFFITVNSLFLLISGLTIALTGTWATWIAAVFGVGLTVFISDLSYLRNLGNLRNLSSLNQISLIRLIGLIGPIVLIGLITILSLIPPLGKAQNPLYTQAQNFPREVQLGFPTSWKISVSAFRDSPFWGTGPGTYTFNFTNYKPVEFNSTKFWNLRFDTPFNEYLQVLANLGGIGLVALLSLTALFISGAYRTYLTYRSDRSNPEKVVLAISGLTFFIILGLHASSLPLWVIGILILASFMVLNRGNNPGLFSFKPRLSGQNSNLKGTFLRLAGLSGSESPETIKVEALPGVLMVAVLAVVLFAGFFGGKFILADYHHRLALNAIARNQGILAYNELVAAEKLNPYNDLYRVNLAQTNFALANAIAAAKGPTEASPTGSLTDQDKQNIQVLLQQSINEGRSAVTLSPRSATNWEILAALYRQIAGVAQNALVFSLDSYGRAIFQDPLNPALRVSVGGVYYAVKNYDLAIRFFTDAINLKPDYPNAYFNLSVALRDKGDLNSAQSVAEKLLTLLEKDSQDYKVGDAYLSDLKNRIASGSAQEPEIQPPAAQTSGALQEESLPKVINLPKPEKIATPEAIKASPVPERYGASPTPNPSPSPSPTPSASPTASP